MLPLLAAVALGSLAGAAALSGLDVLAPAAWAHLAFAFGVMPLILGAMGHFVPVLTRSRGAAAALRAVPLLALMAGGLAVAAFSMPSSWSDAGIAIAAAAGMGAALTHGAWIVRRSSAALGSPHPGVHWYLAACLCLALALAAALAMPFLPEHRAALRLFHLHLNTLGFIGLTAIGTLQVLLPTVVARPDSGAAARLRKDLRYALVGVLLLAAGAGWYPPLAGVGLLLYLWPLLNMLYAWTQGFRAEIMRWHGAAPSLAVASLGLVLLLLAGAAHGAATLAGRPAILALVLGFLLPLVSGAATQLLPLWLRPGARTPWHEILRTHLGWFGAPRAGLMLAGGLLVAVGVPAGTMLAALGIGLFALALARAFVLTPDAPRGGPK